MLREAGVAPGALRMQRYMAQSYSAAARYPREEKDRAFHPWNNDGRQVGVRVPLTRIELAGRHDAYNNIPVTQSLRPSTMLTSTAYGRGFTKNAMMQHAGNGYILNLHA